MLSFASRGLRRVRHLVGSRARLWWLRAQFPGFAATKGTTIARGCDIYVGRGSTLRLDACNVGRGVTLTTSPGSVMEIAADLVGPGSVVVARESIRIARGVKIAEYVTIRDANHDHTFPLGEGRFRTAPVEVGEDVWLAAKATVLAGVTVGRGATVAAGAVVTRDIEPGATVAGVPARPMTSRTG